MASELHIPQNMTFGSNSPSGVVKAAFYWSSGLMRTLLYPYSALNFVKINDSQSLLMRSEIKGERIGILDCVAVEIPVVLAGV